MNPPWRYRLLVRLLSAAMIGYTLWRAVKDGGWRYLQQRLGFYGTSRDENTSLWVHAASVGEVLTVLPLVKLYLLKNVDATVLFTTGTPTGAAVLQKQDLAGVKHQFLPIDFPGACKRFVKQIPCSKGWIVETEIWPWLYAICNQQGVDLTIVNGRLSERTSVQANGMLASSYRSALLPVKVLARSDADRQRFTALGAVTENVQVAGNLKYSATEVASSSERLIKQDYVLAASTHEDEELQLVRAWKHAMDAREPNAPSSLLVIAPRHPERAAAILRQLSQTGVTSRQRSLGESPESDALVYLADTLGELQAWYEFAQATFVGGSLIDRGGHNMLEPARFCCPTVVGPYTYNFDDVMQVLQDANAINIAQSADEVVSRLLQACDTPEDMQSMAGRAQKVARESQAVLPRYEELLNF